MFWRRTLIIAALATGFGASAVAVKPFGPKPAGGAAAVPAPGAPGADEGVAAPANREVLFQSLLKLIRHTEEPSAAMRAYGRACAIDRSNPALHETYMRKMLSLGLPQVARYPARALIASGRHDGAAWGVIGYTFAKQGQLDEALAATIRAADGAGTNPGILNNLGQLCAWYDNALDLPKLPDAALRMLHKKRRVWAAQPEFAQAYDRIRDEYRQSERIENDLRKELASAERNADAVFSRAVEIDRRLRRIRADIDAARDRIKAMRRDYYYATLYVPYADDVVITGHYLGPNVYYPRYYYLYREELGRRIGGERRGLRRLEADYDALRREGRAILRRFRDKQAQAEQIRRRGEVIPNRIERRFRWDPPAVDGVVHAARDRIAAPAGRKAAVPSDPQTEAAELLNLSRLLIANDRPDKARPILERIVRDYSKTPAAKEAQRLLPSLPKARAK